jgi:protoporphyrinogen oxidase
MRSGTRVRAFSLESLLFRSDIAYPEVSAFAALAAISFTPMTGRIPISILGAGPAGVGVACKLAQRAVFDVRVIERGSVAGGNAGSFELAGMRVDYGSHRLHPSCAPEILSDIKQMLGEELLDRPRHGRILLRGRWLHFPLRPQDLIVHAPPSFLAGVALDALSKTSRPRNGDTFAAVLESGLGPTICREFYFPYARKIWGVDPAILDAEQARRRVAAGSVAKIARKILGAVPGFKPKTGGRFYYPKRGFGSISEAYAVEAAVAGACLKFRNSVSAIETLDGRAVAVRTLGPAGEERFEARQVFSTIPITQLAKRIEPTAPEEVLRAADGLQFRAMILIYMVLGTQRFTEYDAHYFPGAGIPITRLSEPKNYGLAQSPGSTVLCAELPCAVEDRVWKASDGELLVLMKNALETAGLPVRCPVVHMETRKLAQAYPIYTRGYMEKFEKIDGWLSRIDGLVTFGRQGLFAHDNTHHALAMSYGLAECLRNDGTFDNRRWNQYRQEFQKHVVED